MFNNFEDFKKDFMEKIGNKANFQTKYNLVQENNKFTHIEVPNTICTAQSRITETKSWDGDWNSITGIYSEDFGQLRNEIIESVQHFYKITTASINRFISDKSDHNQNWISSVKEESYSRYYDGGYNQIIDIYLDKLFNLIKEREK